MSSKTQDLSNVCNDLCIYWVSFHFSSWHMALDPYFLNAWSFDQWTVAVLMSLDLPFICMVHLVLLFHLFYYIHNCFVELWGNMLRDSEFGVLGYSFYEMKCDNTDRQTTTPDMMSVFVFCSKCCSCLRATSVFILSIKSARNWWNVLLSYPDCEKINQVEMVFWWFIATLKMLLNAWWI